jgi:putative heme-binding domain-containing protein
MDGLDTAGLVAALEGPSGWQRDTAQMMLLWRNDPAAVAPLERLARKAKDPRARLHALCTVDGLGKLTPEALWRAMKDEHAAVRRHAVRLAEGRGATSRDLQTATALLADDPDPRVRLQVAFTAGEWEGPEAAGALVKLALTAGDDVYLNAAVMSSAMKHYRAVAEALLEAGRTGGPVMRDLLAMSLAVGDRELMARLLGPVLVPANGRHTGTQFEQFGRFLDHLAQHRTSMWKLMEAAQDPLTERLRQSETVIESARRFADDPNHPTAERAAAVALLAREEQRLDEDVRRLAALVGDPGHTAADVQAAAVRALGRVDRPEVPALLTARWNDLPQPVRTGVLDVLLAREPGAWHLLKAVESKQIAAADLDVSRRQRLVNHSSQRVKALARELLGEAADASAGGRKKAVESYKSVLAASGDAKRGEKVFLQNCATCHRLGGVGQEVGPNLESVRSWPPDALLTSILDPNRAAEPRYLAFTATTNDGETIQGVVTAETPAAVTMKSLDGKERVIPRSNLKTLVNTTRSFMPDGLEAAIPPEQMADLIRYLQSPPQ